MTDPRLSTHTRRAIKTHWRKLALPQCQHPQCLHPETPIDYTAPPGTPYALDIDEITTRDDGGNPEDITNTRPTHATCNRTAGTTITNRKRRQRNNTTPTDQWL